VLQTEHAVKGNQRKQANYNRGSSKRS